MESHNHGAIKHNNKASQCLRVKIPNSEGVLIPIRAVNGAKVQTQIVGFILLMTEIIITDFKSLI